MKKTVETNFKCDYCHRGFVREKTLFSHLCETKQRFNDMDKVPNRIAYNAWIMFYNSLAMSKKERTKLDFAKSTYYLSFFKFGCYCVDVDIVDAEHYTKWLIRSNKKIDQWISDSIYEEYLKYYLKKEDPYNAVIRSIKNMDRLSESENIRGHDYLRYVNSNKICYQITKGKISPWVLYLSNSGSKFLSNLNEHQEKFILEYIDPVEWKKIIEHDDVTKSDVVKILNESNY